MNVFIALKGTQFLNFICSMITVFSETHFGATTDQILCYRMRPPISLIHSKYQYRVMKKRDLSTMKDMDLKFNTIIE